MILACVAIGVYTKGKANMLTPPVRTGDQLYDSTVDDVEDPTMFVTFKDSHACPKYVIASYEKN
jgi:poly [ADP-ribose] polymerase 10/14/15